MMNELTLTNGNEALLLPVRPRVAVSVRAGTMADLPFIDALQKRQSKQVGFMPRGQLIGKVEAGDVLVAEAVRDERREMREDRSPVTDLSPLLSHLSAGTPAGYLIATDRYFKRDDVGVIYQMNVLPEYRRHLVAATLLQAQFDRSAYGCKLYGCWCAQDIEANRFWEAMGFVPLAVRMGGRGKALRSADCGVRIEGDAGLLNPQSEIRNPQSTGRVHIYWQKRIRRGDVTTPWWFPCQTSGGSIREDRVVLPIPPGTHWSEAVAAGVEDCGVQSADCGVKTGTRATGSRRTLANPKSEIRTPQSRRVQFGAPTAEPMVTAPAPAEPRAIVKAPRVKTKVDPRVKAAARELRDRWLEEMNGSGYQPVTNAKYAVGRVMESARALPAA